MIPLHSPVMLHHTCAKSTALMGAVGFARAAANVSRDRGCVRGSGPSKLIGGEASGSARSLTLANLRGSVKARQAPFDIFQHVTYGCVGEVGLIDRPDGCVGASMHVPGDGGGGRGVCECPLFAC